MWWVFKIILYSDSKKKKKKLYSFLILSVCLLLFSAMFGILECLSVRCLCACIAKTHADFSWLVFFPKKKNVILYYIELSCYKEHSEWQVWIIYGIHIFLSALEKLSPKPTGHKRHELLSFNSVAVSLTHVIMDWKFGNRSKQIKFLLEVMEMNWLSTWWSDIPRAAAQRRPCPGRLRRSCLCSSDAASLQDSPPGEARPFSSSTSLLNIWKGFSHYSGELQFYKICFDRVFLWFTKEL